jgi:hypothetical protein
VAPWSTARLAGSRAYGCMATLQATQRLGGDDRIAPLGASGQRLGVLHNLGRRLYVFELLSGAGSRLCFSRNATPTQVTHQGERRNGRTWDKLAAPTAKDDHQVRWVCTHRAPPPTSSPTLQAGHNCAWLSWSPLLVGTFMLSRPASESAMIVRSRCRT